MIDPKFSKFHGIDREKIQWNPEIDENKCIGCGMCAASCGRGVFRFDYGTRKAKVVNPTHCMVACQTCANLCPSGAISFSQEGKSREKAQKIVKDFKLISIIKSELDARKEELQYKNQ